MTTPPDKNPPNHPVTEPELQARATAPRVTLADLHNRIKYVGYFTAADGAFTTGLIYRGVEHQLIDDFEEAVQQPLSLLTVCVIVADNGFTVLGKSACAAPENFDANIGRRLAFKDAEGQLWSLLGFELRSKLMQQERQA